MLLIEDDDRIVRFLKRGLEAEYYALDIATDGQMGIDMAESMSYDVIILDLMLPVKGGREVYRHLREADIKTPILVLTAVDSLQTKIQSLREGVDDYLTKPFSFEELLARLQALVRRTGKTPKEETSILEVADLRLDQESHEVTRGNQPISLTHKEFLLLEYLMRYPNKVLSRAMILEHVWGYHYDSMTNVVDVYIRYLRNKVDRDHPQKLIHTIRGVGYKIST
ncbi:MAG TPA: response regulator transcription factor [Nitrospiria bacterium]|nr:response regulator transcription factor [Nitrospiria bacterium]